MLRRLVGTTAPGHHDCSIQASRRTVLLARWIVRSAVRNCWKQWTREGSLARKTGSGGDQKDHEGRASKDRAASTCGPPSDSFNDTSRRRVKQLFHKQFPDTLQKQI
ncbi:hypothetical protein TNCV_4502771 [Trichonephila clavipes]|nr:hypothetical protein TNCV_4502771 [Trichonephila clavipes]